MKYLLIDGHSILNRAYYGVPLLTNSKGLHTNAVYGFLNILFKLIEEEKPEYLTVAFDVHAPTFRHELYPEYKGNRKGMDEELKEQLPVIKELLMAMGVDIKTLAGYEADDIIGTLSKQAEDMGVDVSIVSGDRDLLQLTSKTTKLIIPKTKKSGTEIEEYYEDDVIEKYHVTPIEFIDVKALQGDSSDNFPGVSGIGEKGAQSLISEYHSIENAYEHLEEIKQKRTREALRENYEMGLLCKKLAAINRTSPVSFSSEEAAIKNIYTPEAYEMIKNLELKKLADKFAAAGGSVAEEVNIKESDIAADIIPYKDEAGTFISLVKEKGKIKGVVAAGVDKEAVFVRGDSEDELKEAVYETVKGAKHLISCDLKEVLHFAFDKKETPFYEEKYEDIAVARYLINPLAKFAAESEREAIEAYAGFADVKKELEEKGMTELYLKVEMPLVFTLYGMEREGILIKKDELDAYGQKLLAGIEKLEKEIYEEAGEEFNILSPKQLGVILFEKMGIKGGKKTKTGYSTAADVLEKLAGEYPIVNSILLYRQLTKLKSTYADALSGYADEGGRIHTVFNQTVTATGRLSSSDPNLQNIPVRMELGREIRKVFVPKEGFVFIDADYSQIELRVLAHLSGDEKLIEAYKSAQDIHALTASQVFNVPFDEVTELQRRNAKAVNFGIIYGMSSFGLSEDLGITRKEAAGYMEQYFETYPAIKGYLDSLVEKAKESGYAETMFGRIRPLPEIKSSNFMQRSFGERVAMNAPIQGTAADIIKIAMNNVYKRLKDEQLKSRLILQVHDELLIEAAEDEADKVRNILKEEMEGAANLKVKLETDIGMGKSWQEAH